MRYSRILFSTCIRVLIKKKKERKKREIQKLARTKRIFFEGVSLFPGNRVESWVLGGVVEVELGIGFAVLVCGHLRRGWGTGLNGWRFQSWIDNGYLNDKLVRCFSKTG